MGQILLNTSQITFSNENFSPRKILNHQPGLKLLKFRTTEEYTKSSQNNNIIIQHHCVIGRLWPHK